MPNIPGKRNLPEVPDLTRLFNDNPRAGQKLVNFLRQILDYIQGVPGGFRRTTPLTIIAGTTGDPGTESAGWMAADALAPISTGVPPNATGQVAAEGTGTALMRASATIKQGIVTTKGDILTFGTLPDREPVGGNGTVLTADSSKPRGLAWISTSGLFASGGFPVSTGGDGDDGPPGPPGVGLNGAPGVAGPAGALGPPGPDGVDGTDGAIGPPGDAGPTGATGAAGAAGPPGTTGVDGDDGAIGPPGNAGATGAPGPAGADGVPGPVGADGDDGLPGPIGLTGFTGAAGADGIAGPMGQPGMDGDDGAWGPPGQNAPFYDPPQGSYAPGSFLVATGKFGMMVRELSLSGTQRVLLEGTARLTILN